MNEKTLVDTVIDPVCQMEIDPADAVAAATFEGETIFFCSRGCEAKFHASPDTYLLRVKPSSTGCCSVQRQSCCG